MTYRALNNCFSTEPVEELAAKVTRPTKRCAVRLGVPDQIVTVTSGGRARRAGWNRCRMRKGMFRLPADQDCRLSCPRWFIAEVPGANIAPPGRVKFSWNPLCFPPESCLRATSRVTNTTFSGYIPRSATAAHPLLNIDGMNRLNRDNYVNLLRRSCRRQSRQANPFPV